MPYAERERKPRIIERIIGIADLVPGAENITTGVPFKNAQELAREVQLMLEFPISERVQREAGGLQIIWPLEGFRSGMTDKWCYVTDKASPVSVRQGRVRNFAQMTVGSYLMLIPALNKPTPLAPGIEIIRILKPLK